MYDDSGYGRNCVALIQGFSHADVDADSAGNLTMIEP